MPAASPLVIPSLPHAKTHCGMSLFDQGRPKSLLTLTHHGGLFEKLEAGFKCHLLQRGGT